MFIFQFCFWLRGNSDLQQDYGISHSLRDIRDTFVSLGSTSTSALCTGHTVKGWCLPFKCLTVQERALVVKMVRTLLMTL